MTSRQIAILNALVTFAAENVPGGLSAEEQEVAKMVAGRAGFLIGDRRTHNYKIINPTHHSSLQEALDAYAGFGWRVVATIPAIRPGYATEIILERPVGVSYPDDP